MGIDRSLLALIEQRSAGKKEDGRFSVVETLNVSMGQIPGGLL
jgi:hypothetical protein